ncbi:predicted protein, partial [Nematostella vectensis]
MPKDSDAVLDLNGNAQLNISGVRFELLWSSIKEFPFTRLGKVYFWYEHGDNWQELCDGVKMGEKTAEVFFQRDPEIFKTIMCYYRNGKFHFPRTICIEHFQRELKYWGISIKNMGDCCYNHFHQENEAVENLMKIKEAFKKDLNMKKEQDEVDLLLEVESRSKLARLKRKMWDLFENPHSSFMAKIVYLLSSFFVMLSTVALCLNTIDSLRIKLDNGETADNAVLAGIEAGCIAWFTVEYLIRLLSAPRIVPFLKSIMNTIDLLAILPYYFELLSLAFDNQLDYRFVEMRRILQILRILRIVRIFKMARHSVGLQTLAYTFKQSTAELGLLGTLLIMGMTLFSSLVYFAEEAEPNSMFKSIPEAFWWSIITMTTVGYGDVYPVTPLGKLVGSLCCISGIIFIALPIPTIVSNFSQFYKDQRKSVEVRRR